MSQKIFVTGVSGCVGHYVFDVISNDPDNLIYLLVRDPGKLRFDPNDFPNVTVIKDDLKNINKYADLLKEMDILIHMAADFGSDEPNYNYALDLLKLLDPKRCKKVINFSTASILGPDNKPVPEAESIGTNYVRSKYRLYKKLPELEISSRVVTLFPTWVLGGDKTHPYSHASAGILDLKKWLWLIRYFKVDASFHFIHAKDIALLVKYLLENEVKQKDLVLGNAPITAAEFIKKTCAFFKIPVRFQLPLSPSLAQFLAFVTRRELHSWDLYCFKRRHFVFKTANARTFGLESDLETVNQILLDAFSESPLEI
jgi:nucleoside-diphosphate-sugar epimerase